MKTDRRPWLALPLLLLLLAICGAPLFAQADEEEDDGRWLKFYAEGALWASQPVGLDFIGATRQDSGNIFATQILDHGFGTNAKARWRGGVQLKKDMGSLILTWFGTSEEDSMRELLPGDYVFGQQLSHPLYAGFNNDGLADGYESYARAVLRDFRIDYYRKAFENDRVKAKWFVGYRRIRHERRQDATYYSILNDLPPLLPPLTPNPLLAPLADTAGTLSSYKGRGIEAGMEFQVPFFNDKLVLESELSVGIIRGKTSSSWRSANAAYVLNGVVLMPSEYAVAFETSSTDITQVVFGTGFQSLSTSSSGETVEASLGLRWHAWRGFDLLMGFRASYYGDAGSDVRPATEGIFNPTGITTTQRSVSHEGFYGGAAWTF